MRLDCGHQTITKYNAEYHRKYRLANLERIKERKKKHYQENREYILSREKERYERLADEIALKPKKYDRSTDHAKAVAKNAYLKRTYGISLDEYNELLQKQEEKCAVCKRHKDEFSHGLAVDHDHKTGEIRGLLCTHCNHRLVGRHRETDILKAVISYLEGDFTGWFVPAKKKKPRKNRRRKVAKDN